MANQIQFSSSSEVFVCIVQQNNNFRFFKTFPMLTLMRSFILRFTGAWAKPHCIVFPGLTQPWLTLGGRGWKDKKSRKQSKKDCRKDLLYTQCGEYSHIQVAVRSKSKISYILVPVPLQITFQIKTGQIGSASGSDLKNPKYQSLYSRCFRIGLGMVTHAVFAHSRFGVHTKQV